MKKRLSGKIMALILCLVVAVSMCSLTALAEDSAPPAKPSGETGEQTGGPGNEAGDQGGPGGQGDQGGQTGGPGGQAGGADTQKFDYNGTYSAVLTADGTTVESKGKTLETKTADQNVALAQNGGILKITDATMKKSGDDSDGDNCNFYGVNSSVLSVGDKSAIYISDSSISSTSEGSNGIFATDNAKVYANNDSITTTTGGNARGLDATYGGTIIANKMEISTAKEHCAALATDRGGGYISATNSKLNTAGSGSPLIYSTGNIEVGNVSGTATGSQIAGMEGQNKIVIYNSKLESTNNAISGSDPIKDAVILYQSTSGDADTSTSSKADFQVKDSTLKTSIKGGSTDAAFFYVTNVTANIVMDNTTLDYDADSVYLLYASGNSSNNWGTEGSNGGNATFTAIGEDALKGDILVGDTYSSADVYLTKGTKYTGKTTGDGVSKANISIDSSSEWVVTGNCTVGDMNLATGGKVIDSTGKTVTIRTSSGTVQSGTSDITVTIKGKYGTSVSAPATSVCEAEISRTDFDSYYGTNTAIDSSSGGSETAAPPATSITKLSRLTKGFKITWKKKTGITGYQIVCGTNKACTKNKKTVTVKSAEATSKTIKGLKKNRTYYVKIRTYKSSTSNASAWSKVSKIKTK